MKWGLRGSLHPGRHVFVSFLPHLLVANSFRKALHCIEMYSSIIRLTSRSCEGEYFEDGSKPCTPAWVILMDVGIKLAGRQRDAHPPTHVAFPSPILSTPVNVTEMNISHKTAYGWTCAQWKYMKISVVDSCTQLTSVWSRRCMKAPLQRANLPAALNRRISWNPHLLSHQHVGITCFRQT